MSSQIAAIGHDPHTNKLQIEFKSWKPEKPNSIYEYANVTTQEFAAFSAAESKGKFFKDNIKPFDKRFPYRRLTPEEAAK